MPDEQVETLVTWDGMHPAVSALYPLELFPDRRWEASDQLHLEAERETPLWLVPSSLTSPLSLPPPPLPVTAPRAPCLDPKRFH